MSQRGAYSLKARVVALFSIDLRSLAAMRCLGALTMLWCLIVWAPDLSFYFTDEGVLKRAEFPGRFDWARFSVLHLVDGYGFVLALWLIGFVSALALLVGYRARLASLLCWLIYLSFAGRNPMLLQGGDVLLPILFFWMAFLPVSAVYAVDAALDPADRRGETHLSIATVGLLLQVVYVYVFGALIKTGEAWIPNGSAIYLALHIDTFVTPMGMILREYPQIMQPLTYFVYYLELLAPVLLFFPDKRQFVRMMTLAALWLMHLGFRIFLHIGHFWMASLTSLCAYVPSRVWNWIARWYFSEAQRGIRIYYDRDCGFCLKTALILREFFLPRCVPVTPAQDDPVIGPVLEREVSWVVIDAAGAQRLHWDAVAYVMSQSPVLRPFGWLARLYGLIGLGDPTYRMIGNSRKGLGAITGALLSPVPTIPTLALPTRALLGAVIAFCFVWNVQGLEGATKFIADDSAIATTARKAGFSQRWQMFSPSPIRTDGFPIFEAKTDEGEAIDIFPAPPRELSFETPEDVVGLFDNHRHRAVALNAWFRGGEDRVMFMSRLARQRCDQVNMDRTGAARVTSVTMHFLQNETKSNYEEAVTLIRIGEVACGE